MKVHILLSSLSLPAWPSRDQGHQGPSCCGDPISHSPLGLPRPPATPSVLSLPLFAVYPYSKQETKRSLPSASLSWDSMTQVSFLPNSLGSLLTPWRTSAFYNFSSQGSCCCPTGMKWENRCRAWGSEAHGRVTTERETRLAFRSQRDSISQGAPRMQLLLCLHG